jgi:Ser/Thr protein kinase RdoA (MazF antagonist)
VTTLPGVTHQVSIDAERAIVTKRFRSSGRGEPAREWQALTLLAEYAPGLAAEPLAAALDASPPVIEMSWLPGTPLSSGPLSAAQARQLAAALQRLWRSVPGERLRGSGWPANPAALTRQVRGRVRAAGQDGLQAGAVLGDDPAVRQAHAAAVAWLHAAALDSTVVGSAGERSGLVLGQGDPNLANFLWDGEQVRLVDFEDSGPSDRAFELAILVEHISAWSDAGLEAGAFLELFELGSAEQRRLREYRRLAALFWLMLLAPGSRASQRNPPGTLRRQADRLLALLG